MAEASNNSIEQQLALLNEFNTKAEQSKQAADQLSGAIKNLSGGMQQLMVMVTKVAQSFDTLTQPLQQSSKQLTALTQSTKASANQVKALSQHMQHNHQQAKQMAESATKAAFAVAKIEQSSDGGTSKLNKLAGGLSKSTMWLKSLGGGILVGAQMIGSFVDSALDSISPLMQLSDKTGIAVGQLHKLQYAAVKSGSSSEALQESLANLSQKMAEAGQNGADNFKQLGVDIVDASGNLKGADTVLFELGQKLKHVSSIPERVNLAQKLGINADTLNLITQSQQSIQRLMGEADKFGSMSNGQVEQVNKLSASMATFQHGFSAMQNELLIALAPALTKIVDFLNTVILNNMGTIKAIIGFLGDLCNGVVDLVSFIWQLGQGFADAFQCVSPLVSLLMLIFSPEGMLVSGIVLVTSFLVKLFAALANGQEGISKFFSDLLNGFKSIFSGFGKSINQFFTDVFTNITNLPKTIYQAIKQDFAMIKHAVIDMLPDFLKSALSKMGLLSEADTSVELVNNQVALTQPVLQPGSGVLAVNKAQNTVINNNSKIMVTGAEKPQEHGQIIQDYLNRQMQDSVYQVRAMGAV